MGDHINADGRFQSDKYPTCPPGKVPLSTSDPLAQDLLWEYAQRRRAIDAEFSEDLETCLKADGYTQLREDGLSPGVRFSLRGGATVRICDPCAIVSIGDGKPLVRVFGGNGRYLRGAEQFSAVTPALRVLEHFVEGVVWDQVNDPSRTEPIKAESAQQ
jgi:hypothetical protein